MKVTWPPCGCWSKNSSKQKQCGQQRGLCYFTKKAFSEAVWPLTSEERKALPNNAKPSPGSHHRPPWLAWGAGWPRLEGPRAGHCPAVWARRGLLEAGLTCVLGTGEGAAALNLEMVSGENLTTTAHCPCGPPPCLLTCPAWENWSPGIVPCTALQAHVKPLHPNSCPKEGTLIPLIRVQQGLH